jgi:hypothetical protein
VRIEGDSFLEILAKVQTADYRARLASIVTLEGEMKDRIHGRGLKTDGSPMGNYRSRWRKVREQNGYQTGYVDLSFNGDLQRGLQTGTNDRTPVLGFTSDEQFEKADGLSFGNGAWSGFGEIYTPSTDEIDNLANAYVSQLDREFDALR